MIWLFQIWLRDRKGATEQNKLLSEPAFTSVVHMSADFVLITQCLHQLRLKCISVAQSHVQAPWMFLTVLIIVAFFFAVSQTASAIEIHADPEVIVPNGTAAILRCTFTSSEVVQSTTTVTWSFQSNQPDNKFFKSPYVVSRPNNRRFCTAGFPQLPVFLRLCHLHRRMKKCSGSRLAPTHTHTHAHCYSIIYLSSFAFWIIYFLQLYYWSLSFYLTSCFFSLTYFLFL